jgi:hypothetical protein
MSMPLSLDASALNELISTEHDVERILTIQSWPIHEAAGPALAHDMSLS